MGRLYVNCLSVSLIFLLGIASLSHTTAVGEIPEWVPGETDLSNYLLLWNDTVYVDNFICESTSNLTLYSQVWYQNNSADEPISIIAASQMDLGVDVLAEKLKVQMKILIAIAFPDFSGSTGWDFFVFLLNRTYGTTNTVTAELSGWDAAIECNTTGTHFNYFIIGMLDDSKMGISFALDLNGGYWFNLMAHQIGALIGNYVSTVLLIAAFFATLGAECPESSTEVASANVALEPSHNIPNAAVDDISYTSRDSMIDFNSKLGQFVNPMTSIPSFGANFLLFCTVPTLGYIGFQSRKRHR